MPFELIPGFRILTSRALGSVVVPPYPHPERLKKYKKRTLRRWAQKRAYTVGNGEYLLDKRTGAIYCHPDDLRTLELALKQYAQFRGQRRGAF